MEALFRPQMQLLVFEKGSGTCKLLSADISAQVLAAVARQVRQAPLASGKRALALAGSGGGGAGWGGGLARPPPDGLLFSSLSLADALLGSDGPVRQGECSFCLTESKLSVEKAADCLQGQLPLAVPRSPRCAALRCPSRAEWHTAVTLAVLRTLRSHP